jgi:hypothetical protein
MFSLIGGLKMEIYSHIKLVFSFVIVIFLAIFTSNTSFASDKYNLQHNEIKRIEIQDEADDLEKEGIQLQATSSVLQKRYFFNYYPSCYVYYSIDRKMYYYLEDDNWKICAFLPKNFKGKLGEYVKLEMDTNKPYTHHRQHVKKFAQIESKKKKKSFLAKVIYIMLYKH